MEIATVTTVLAPLAVLACPVGMGLMMWLMARGNRGERGSDRQATSEQPPSLEVLREEQRRLNEEIEVLERRHASGAEAPPERR